MLVKDVMTTDVLTVRPDTSFKDTVELLVENRVSGVPVVDGRHGSKYTRYIPIPNSPHGVNTAPDGIRVVVSGKLSPPVSVIDVRKLDDLFDDPLVAGRDDRHLRHGRIERRSDREAFNVEAPAAEEARDTGEHAELVFNRDQNDVFHARP